jgi:hypothetical protein
MIILVLMIIMAAIAATIVESRDSGEGCIGKGASSQIMLKKRYYTSKTKDALIAIGY